MRRLLQEEKDGIEYTVMYGIDRLLRFKASFDLHRYLQEKSRIQYSELELELHSSEYPISGTGIRATRAMLTARDNDLDGEFYFDEVALAPEQQVAELDAFPMEAASASYVFGILEDIGNTIVDIVDPGKRSARSAWHSKVYGDTDPKIRVALNKARDGFAAPFGVKRNRIPTLSTKRLIWLKASRNAYIHDLKANIEFERFFRYALIIACQLGFIALPSLSEINKYPFEDHFSQFR